MKKKNPKSKSKSKLINNQNTETENAERHGPQNDMSPQNDIKLHKICYIKSFAKSYHWNNVSESLHWNRLLDVSRWNFVVLFQDFRDINKYFSSNLEGNHCIFCLYSFSQSSAETVMIQTLFVIHVTWLNMPKEKDNETITHIISKWIQMVKIVLKYHEKCFTFCKFHRCQMFMVYVQWSIYGENAFFRIFIVHDLRSTKSILSSYNWCEYSLCI